MSLIKKLDKGGKTKKDACYHKVKAAYDVWPSAYASEALVKCRKVGAENWGNSKKENGGIIKADGGTKISKDKMKCNSPRNSWRSGKDKVVKACENGKEKIVHYGDSSMKHNYSKKANKSYRARAKCDQNKSKLSAGYWSCKDLWPKREYGGLIKRYGK